MARLTTLGVDYVVLDETNIETEKEKHETKVHLIELNFKEPTEELLQKVIGLFPETRRFVVSNFIRFYNNQFKKYKDKKYYVKNQSGDNLFIFLKRNNKVLLDLSVLDKLEKQLLYRDLRMILDYVEVVKIDKVDYEVYISSFKTWKGNIIVEGG